MPFRPLLLLILSLSSLPASAATLLVLGDSISAGYGLRRQQGWVELMAQQLAPQHQVINASQSGETTAGGLTRLPRLLKKHQPDLVLIELGANDGLRGLPLDQMQDNLGKLIRRSRAAGARPVLIGISLPPNYGFEYQGRFKLIYKQLARREKVPLVPFLLAGFADNLGYFQTDGLHPNSRAQPLMRDTVLKTVRPLLKDPASRPRSK